MLVNAATALEWHESNARDIAVTRSSRSSCVRVAHIGVGHFPMGALSGGFDRTGLRHFFRDAAEGCPCRFFLRFLSLFITHDDIRREAIHVRSELEDSCSVFA